MGPEEVQGRVPFYRSDMPCGNRYMDDFRALGKQLHRNKPMYPEGHIGPVPCAEEAAAKKLRKGANWAPYRATVRSLGTEMA